MTLLRRAGSFFRNYPSLRPAIVHGLLREGETANLIAATKVGKSWQADRERRDRQDNREKLKAEESIRAAFRSLGAESHIKAHVLDRTGTSRRGKAIQTVWGEMLRRGEIRMKGGACRGGNKTPCDG
jgi:hypothetical protein